MPANKARNVPGCGKSCSCPTQALNYQTVPMAPQSTSLPVTGRSSLDETFVEIGATMLALGASIEVLRRKMKKS